MFDIFFNLCRRNSDGVFSVNLRAIQKGNKKYKGYVTMI